VTAATGQLLLDGPLGSETREGFGAREVSDSPAVATAVTYGVVRVPKSRNTPAPNRAVA
jgi:hypothetical protein